MKLLNQLVRFFAIGGFSTLVDFAIYMLLSTQLTIGISKAISMTFASALSYFFSKNWIFKDQTKKNSIYIFKFYIIVFINLLTNIVINSILFQISDMKIFSFVIATLCTMTINFLFQRYWIFKI